MLCDECHHHSEYWTVYECVRKFSAIFIWCYNVFAIYCFTQEKNQAKEEKRSSKSFIWFIFICVSVFSASYLPPRPLPSFCGRINKTTYYRFLCKFTWYFFYFSSFDTTRFVARDIFICVCCAWAYVNFAFFSVGFVSSLCHSIRYCIHLLSPFFFVFSITTSLMILFEKTTGSTTNKYSIYLMRTFVLDVSKQQQLSFAVSFRLFLFLAIYFRS